MSQPRFLGIAGSFSTPSRTRALVEEAVDRATAVHGGLSEVVDLSQLGRDFAGIRDPRNLTGTGSRLIEAIGEASALIVAAPVYKGSYPGLFKHLFDLIDPVALLDKPVLLGATGGGEKHALVIEHHLRPLFGFFEAQTLGTGVYASDRDFVDGRLASVAVLQRLDRAVAQFEPYLQRENAPVLAAHIDRWRGRQPVAVNS